MVTEQAPFSGMGVKYGAFGRCGVTGMVVEVSLGVGRFDVERGAEMTVVNTDIDIPCHFSGLVPGLIFQLTKLVPYQMCIL